MRQTIRSILDIGIWMDFRKKFIINMINVIENIFISYILFYF